MAKFQLQRTLDVPFDRAFFALAQIDQHRTFIPGCSESLITSCSKPPSDGLWHGTVRYACELKKYGVHETAVFQFAVNAHDGTVTFASPAEAKNGFTGHISYVLRDGQNGNCQVCLTVEYQLQNKAFFWIAAKPLISRFFSKYLDLVEGHAQGLTGPLSVDLDAGPSNAAPKRAVRGFQQLDERSHEARMKVLSCFDVGSVGAEVGTYMGAFAQLILTIVKPSELYLIDPWTASPRESQAGSWYETVDQAYMDEIFQMVSERFAPANVPCRVEIVRDYSANALRAFKDGALDWVYIDGDHSYDSVLNDLTLSYAKVRKGGHISGDDYRVVDNWWKDNVVRAVKEFAATHPVDFILEDGSQFVLQKR